jgi:hypothetical protein
MTRTLCIARISILALAFNVLLIAGRTLSAESSAPKAFPDGKMATKSLPPQQNKAQAAQQSTLSKMTASTRRFFSRVGDAFSFKKSSPATKPTTPTNPWIKPPKEEPKPSWLTSIFPKEEPKKPHSPSQWLEQKRLDP